MQKTWHVQILNPAFGLRCTRWWRFVHQWALDLTSGNLTHLLLRFLGLQEGMPVCNRLPWISQHFIPVVPAKSLSMASNPHHTNDLIMTHPVEAQARNTMNKSDLTATSHTCHFS